MTDEPRLVCRFIKVKVMLPGADLSVDEAKLAAAAVAAAAAPKIAAPAAAAATKIA